MLVDAILTVSVFSIFGAGVWIEPMAPSMPTIGSTGFTSSLVFNCVCKHDVFGGSPTCATICWDISKDNLVELVLSSHLSVDP